MALKFEKQLRRNLRKQKHKTGNAVDIYNDNVEPVNGKFKILHPTKGFRSNSIKRMIAAEGQPAMYRIFVETMNRARKVA